MMVTVGVTSIGGALQAGLYFRVHSPWILTVTILQMKKLRPKEIK